MDKLVKRVSLSDQPDQRDSPDAQVNELFPETNAANPGPHNNHIEVLSLLWTHRLPLQMIMMNQVAILDLVEGYEDGPRVFLGPIWRPSF